MHHECLLLLVERVEHGLKVLDLLGSLQSGKVGDPRPGDVQVRVVVEGKLLHAW